MTTTKMTHTYNKEAIKFPEKIIKIFVERELRFSKIINKPITREEATKKAEEHYADLILLAEHGYYAK